MAKIIFFLDVFSNPKQKNMYNFKDSKCKDSSLSVEVYMILKDVKQEIFFKDISLDFGALSLEHKCISGLCHAFCKLIKMEHNVAESTI